MTGGRSAYAQRGLIPRTIAALLAALRTAPGLSSWTLGVSYLEIYNEALYDLLDISTQPQDLVLYEDGKGNLQVGVGPGGVGHGQATRG
jgi:kinesin family protein 6/9